MSLQTEVVIQIAGSIAYQEFIAEFPSRNWPGTKQKSSPGSFLFSEGTTSNDLSMQETGLWFLFAWGSELLPISSSIGLLEALL